MISDEKQAIHVIAEAVAKPGQEEALYRTLHACVAPTSDEAGNAAIFCIRIWIIQPGSSFTRLG